MADYLVHRREQILSFVSVLFSTSNHFGIGAEFLQRGESRSVVQRAAAPGKKKVLRAVLFVNLVFVRQVIANGGDVEITGFNQRLDRFDHGRLECGFFVLVVPRSFLLEVFGVLGELNHRIGDFFVCYRYESL